MVIDNYTSTQLFTCATVLGHEHRRPPDLRIRFPPRWWSGSPSASACSGSRCGSGCSTRCARARRPSATSRRPPAPPSRTSPSISASCCAPGSSSRRKEGNFSVYSIADPVVFSLCDEVCGGLRRAGRRARRAARGRQLTMYRPTHAALAARARPVRARRHRDLVERRPGRARLAVVPAADRVRRRQPVALRHRRRLPGLADPQAGLRPALGRLSDRRASDDVRSGPSAGSAATRRPTSGSC